MKRGFTLLEVLISGGILFLVGASVVGLSNNIIQGTSLATDKTAMNLWAQEGLELTKKIRDDTVLTKTSQNSPWLSQAQTFNNYGWYLLTTDANGHQVLQAVGSTVYNISNIGAQPTETLLAGSLTGYRLICIESVGAVTKRDDPGNAYCNYNAAGSVVNDGDRLNIGGGCQTGDTYCSMTESSLEKNQLSSSTKVYVPAGNAVKVRSLVFWYDKSQTRYADISTLLTNWQWSGNAQG